MRQAGIRKFIVDMSLTFSMTAFEFRIWFHGIMELIVDLQQTNDGETDAQKYHPLPSTLLTSENDYIYINHFLISNEHKEIIF